MKKLSWYLPLAAAALAVAVRIPFLLRADGFFNSDEAIEGLMARHLIHWTDGREWPIFFWGQGYKGVPEVYLTAGLSWIAGFGVVQLKVVTLAVWACGVAVTTRLGQRWYGNGAAALTGAFLAIGPPSVIYWSLCANAEVAWMTLLIAGALLAYERVVDGRAARVPALVFVCAGAMLWIHPIGVCAVAALAAIAAARSAWWRAHRWRGVADLAAARDVPRALRPVLLTLHVLILAAAAMFAWTWAGGHISLGFVSAAHPQKVFRTMVVLAGLAGAGHALFGGLVPRVRLARAIGWFALGVLPVVLNLTRGRMPGAAIVNHRLDEFPGLMATLFRSALPIVFGVHDPVSAPALPWWLAWGFAAAMLMQILVARGASVTPSRVFAVWAGIALVVMLFPGGAFQDVHSHRYFMQFSGVAALTAAAGVMWLWARTRIGAAALALLCLAGAAIADIRWYGRLWSDASYTQVTACLVDRGITAATAEYWTAYKMTFLADERLIVAPDDGDRYPPYQAIVAAAPRTARIYFLPSEPRPAGPALCETPILVAVPR